MTKWPTKTVARNDYRDSQHIMRTPFDVKAVIIITNSGSCKGNSVMNGIIFFILRLRLLIYDFACSIFGILFIFYFVLFLLLLFLLLLLLSSPLLLLTYILTQKKIEPDVLPLFLKTSTHTLVTPHEIAFCLFFVLAE